MGGAFARAAIALLASGGNKSAGRAAFDHQRVARRRAHCELPERIELHRRSSDAFSRASKSSGDGSKALPESQQNAAATIIRKLELRKISAVAYHSIAWSDSASKQLIASQAVSALVCICIVCPPNGLPSIRTDLDTLARFINRESALLPVAFYVDASEIDKPAGETTENNRASLLQRFLTRLNCLIFLTRVTCAHFLRRRPLRLDVGKPTRAEQQIAWTESVG